MKLLQFLLMTLTFIIVAVVALPYFIVMVITHWFTSGVEVIKGFWRETMKRTENKNSEEESGGKSQNPEEIIFEDLGV